MERILRRIHRSHVDPDLPVPITRAAFKPNKKRDGEGLSVFRLAFITAEELVRRASQPPERYYVAQLGMRDHLVPLGLTVVPKPTKDQPPGHALIPELNSSTRETTKEKQRQLAEFASKHIVLIPPD